MAIPATPQNYYVQTANGQNYLSWSLAVGATSYSIERSTDGSTYSVLDTATSAEYLDTAVTLGTQYWYKVASVNTDGTSAYTTAQSVVPVPVGEMSLGQIRLNAQQRADRVNSNFVTLPEWNSYINQSMFELYDLLITAYEDYYITGPVFFRTDGSNDTFALPNGSNTFLNAAGSTITPAAFYKLKGVDLGINTQSNSARVTVNKFNFIDRNRYMYPNNNGAAMYGGINMAYRVMGSNIQFIPTPSANQLIGLWFIPRMTMLLKDTDTTTSGISGWLEYVIVDAAIKALQKEESDISALMVQKTALLKRIEETAQNRDAGQPATISNIRANEGDGSGGPGWNGNWGGM